MIRSRLAELTTDALLDLAADHDLEVGDDISREELVDLIAEEIEDAILESELNDNYPIQVERRKYDLTGGVGASRTPEELSEVELPERYGETRVVVMLRDPAWAYAYWDLPDCPVDPAGDERVEADLLLRVVEIRDGAQAVGHELDSFDIPVLHTDSSRYINLPNQETRYRIDLVSRTDEAETVLGSSNTVIVPLGYFAPLGDDDAARRTEQITAMSGLQKLNVPTFGDGIPQRIISVFDETETELEPMRP